MSTFCSTIRCNEEKDVIVGTSTSCSASCGSRTGVRTESSTVWPLDPLLRPDLREPVRPGALGGRCFVEAEKEVLCSFRLGRELLRIVSVKFNSYSLPRPLPSSGALCAMVRGLGKGHGDAHPLMSEERAEASLSPAAGTACAAACIAINVQPLRWWWWWSSSSWSWGSWVRSFVRFDCLFVRSLF